MTRTEQQLDKLKTARSLIDDVQSELKAFSDSEAFLETADSHICEVIRLIRDSEVVS